MVFCMYEQICDTIKGNESLVDLSIFLHHFLKTSKCFILMQTLLQLDIWLQSYDGFDDAKNNMKQRIEHCFGQYLKNNIHGIWLIPLDHVTYGCNSLWEIQ